MSFYIKKLARYFTTVSNDSEEMLVVIKKMLEQEMADRCLYPVFRKDEDYVRTLRSLLKVMDLEGFGYRRVGNPEEDGGYVMADDLDRAKIVYSIGIAREVSFDRFFADRDADVYMYDHTIDGVEKNGRFHWKDKGICGSEQKTDRDKLMTLDEMLKDNGHTECDHMILKMDVEGAEWDVLCSLPEDILMKFDQIVMELHGMLDLSLKDKIKYGLWAVNRTHQLVHVHGNNVGNVLVLDDDFVLPDLIEVTYVRRDMYKLIPSKRFFPTSLDVRSVPIFPEISLGYWD